jgi:hypothetical protein
MRVCVCVCEGNASLLRWWFRGRNTTLIKDRSLRVDLTTNASLGTLQINIEGIYTTLASVSDLSDDVVGGLHILPCPSRVPASELKTVADPGQIVKPFDVARLLAHEGRELMCCANKQKKQSSP